ncbi:Sulfate/thiosulfate import ATP-binding protein CysA, partial [Tetrabaena socialis]
LAKRMRFSTPKSLVMFRPHDIKLFKTPPPEDTPMVPAMVADKANLGWIIKYTLRFDDDVECELQLSRDQDEREYNLVVGSRVFVYVNPKAMMGFNPAEVDSAPLVRNMVKHFSTAKGLFRAVDGVDVSIEPSSITALLGPSGSGKTTLLRLVAGLETPTAGSIFFDDVDATDLSVQDRQIGFVFQSYALFNHKTVAENVKFGLEMRRLNVDRDKRVADLLALVQLQGLGDRFPRQLSGGQRQRVALARALASNPRLLLLDEPFGALDAVVRKQLRTGLREIVRSVGVTTIIVTHDQEEAFDLADKVVVFNRGLVEQQGTPTEIIKQPRTPFIMKFVGETNTVPASSMVGGLEREERDVLCLEAGGA